MKKVITLRVEVEISKNAGVVHDSVSLLNSTTTRIIAGITDAINKSQLSPCTVEIKNIINSEE